MLLIKYIAKPMPCHSFQCYYSSLVCANIRLNICFSFTWDSSKGFLLRQFTGRKWKVFELWMKEQNTVIKIECERRRKKCSWDKRAQRSLAISYLLRESGRFFNSEWQRESSGRGGGGEPEVNNLVYTKRRKDMYANRKHETTKYNVVPNLLLQVPNVPAPTKMETPKILAASNVPQTSRKNDQKLRTLWKKYLFIWRNILFILQLCEKGNQNAMTPWR